MDADPQILVCQQKPHGLPVERLVSALQGGYRAEQVTLARTPEAIREAIPDATVVVADSISTDVFAEADQLRLFACSFAGYEHLPLEALADRGVTVTNAAGVHASNAAEHAIGGLLSLQRGLLRARRQQRDLEWRNFRVGELAGGTVTVVGMGAIGTAIAERLRAFDVEVRAVRHSPEKGGPVDAVYGYDGFQTAIATADAVVLACPLTETTTRLVDNAALKVLPPESILVNVARGSVVDTDALVSSLQSNHLAGAMLDVTDPEPLPPDHPLWRFENVLITPHNAGHTPEYYERLAEIVLENVEKARETGSWDDLRNQVAP